MLYCLALFIGGSYEIDHAMRSDDKICVEYFMTFYKINMTESVVLILLKGWKYELPH
jgi:hypothetical protein